MGTEKKKAICALARSLPISRFSSGPGSSLKLQSTNTPTQKSQFRSKCRHSGSPLLSNSSPSHPRFRHTQHLFSVFPLVTPPSVPFPSQAQRLLRFGRPGYSRPTLEQGAILKTETLPVVSVGPSETRESESASSPSSSLFHPHPHLHLHLHLQLLPTQVYSSSPPTIPVHTVVSRTTARRRPPLMRYTTARINSTTHPFVRREVRHPTVSMVVAMANNGCVLDFWLQQRWAREQSDLGSGSSFSPKILTFHTPIRSPFRPLSAAQISPRASSHSVSHFPHHHLVPFTIPC